MVAGHSGRAYVALRAHPDDLTVLRVPGTTTEAAAAVLTQLRRLPERPR
jgi:hypothetical protein